MSSDRFDRLEAKLDKLDERLDRIDISLTQYGEQLKYHIKRTDLLQELVEALRLKMEPVIEQVTFGRVTLKWLTALAVVAGLLKTFGVL